MHFESNLKNTSKILDDVEHNLKEEPNFKTLIKLTGNLNKNLAEYKYFTENQHEKELQFNKKNFENYLKRIKELENIIKSKLLILKKYGEYVNL